MSKPQHPQLAAIDLGSNSFHLSIARLVQGEIQMVERIGEKIQLASSLNDDRILSDDAISRGLSCLERFAQRLKGIPRDSIRIVGTNTLRAARNRQQFIQAAESLLECPVEVISGREEARLIYLGVAHTHSDDQERRLVVDIGGGSTELTIGERFSPMELESLHMGCISYSLRFFSNGQLNKQSFQRAINAAHSELLNIRSHYLRRGWNDVVGSSGTIKAAFHLLNQDKHHHPITLKFLHSLKQQLIGFDSLDKIQLRGIKDNRAAIMPGGIAILIAVFEALEIESMSHSEGALREGLLYDQIGRRQHEDVRERTITALMERYFVDMDYASNVETTALRCLAQTELDSNVNRELLGWSSRLHEIGLAISHSQFQKHGSYLIRHSDLVGFNQREQQQLALLVRNHRRKMALSELESFNPSQRLQLLSLTILLRLAIALHHSRQPEQVPDLKLNLNSGKKLTLKFPKDWLESHPLTQADLEQEAGYLKAIGVTLKFN
ncbi:exopolyphosphatase [Motiliproteus sp. MSK22-1]|uniref:exopolyphosphatase n=1 Tax=Motiliproteus sp. MSK22-1 TaxID=1897630 RepID=UPI000975E5EC|nr:exopolyphosphatase [Motiliproteus sp. MSK22-1]OMH30292.1 exopolyphosphatase [Motiliproteus sp. MSK22-1]